MTFDDLSRQHQADARASGLGGEEGEEEVGGAGKAGAALGDPEFQLGGPS